MDYSKMFVYDIETYKEAFTFSVVRADGKFKQTFQCSKFKNEIDRVLSCIEYLKKNNYYMVGFNNIGFDYPVLHELITKINTEGKSGQWIAKKVFDIAQKQIDSFKDEGFGNTVKYEDQVVKQIDLYRIWHFNNKAKATSLKMLEFNMRMQNIEDLPFGIREELNQEQIAKIVSYNEHDVEATRLFLLESESQLAFRFGLVESLGPNILNADDTKIGSEYFQHRLVQQGIKMKVYQNGKQVLNQTKRDKIKISDCLFDYYKFERPEFQAVYDWFKQQTITETKGVFSDIEEHHLGALSKYVETVVKRQRFKQKPNDKELTEFMRQHPLGWVEEQELKATEYLFDSEGNHVMQYPLDADGTPDLTKKQKKVRVPKKSYWGCWKVAETLNTVVDSYRIDFGVGGVHASLTEKIVRETKSYMIRDADVSSMYPNIAISNRIYPEHLGEVFCEIYQSMYEERKSHPKGSAENAMLKLALNGTYGKSNDKYSVFYDPKFTMSITINGQLSLLMLADRLLGIKGLKLVQLNTDGLTVAMLRETEDEYNQICKQWQKDVGLDLEFVDYSKMVIRDVNNYEAMYTNGKVKRKGAYQYEDLGWHQNQSALVIPMAAEAKMLYNTELKDFIQQRLDEGHVFDFLLRTKVPRNSRLVMQMDDGTEVEQQRICRYYPSKQGGKLVKIMPPLEGDTEERRLSIDSQWKVKTCNNMQDFDGDIDLDYYVSEAEKLVIV